MSTIQATRMRKGMLVKMENDLFRVLELQHVTPGNLRGFVRVKFRNIRSGALADQKLRSEDMVERATLDEKNMQYMYGSGEDHYFMDTETYDQVSMSADEVGDARDYLKENTEVDVLYIDGAPVAVELPNFVELAIAKTDPGLRGDTAQGGNKTATLETGATVQVPLFLNEGDIVKVDTRSGEYLGRVAVAG